MIYEQGGGFGDMSDDIGGDICGDIGRDIYGDCYNSGGEST